MPSPLVVLSALWVLWLLSWLLAAGWSAETATQQTPGSLIRESFPIWIGWILIVRPPGGPLAAPLFAMTRWIGWLGVVLTGIGFAITWWARIHLGRLWSSTVTVKVGHTVIRTGPYAMTRHPIYSGLLLSVAASAVARDSTGAALGALSVAAGLIMKLRHEERLLSERFGEAYRSYTREVAALVPHVW